MLNIIRNINEEEVIICKHCGKKFPKEDLYYLDGGYYCQDCLDEISFICEHCGERFHDKDLCYLDGGYYCQDCLDKISFICEHCGERYANKRNYGDGYTDVCCNCYLNYYTRCVECGRVIYYDTSKYFDDDNSMNEPYCEYCYERELKWHYIHDYSYKPDPIFKGNGKRYFGVELEIDNGGESNDNARKILSIANKDCENIYIKTDGSLDDGLEIVTHPMTLDYHLNSMPWEDICGMALNLGYMSHKTETSGLHVHINRSAFGDTVEEQEKCIARILYFFENNWCELLKFSRRTAEQLNKWAKRYGWKVSPAAVLYDAKNNCKQRYACVNITNHPTIEFRIFRGTLKYNTILATLQLVDAICNVAISMSDWEMTNFGWTDFVLGIDIEKYKELIIYLKERRLYVNEPVNNKEELGGEE